MSVEKVLDNAVLQRLRENNVINQNEVAICTGDLFYAKNVLTNEKRIINSPILTNSQTSESLSENSSKTLLKG